MVIQTKLIVSLLPPALFIYLLFRFSVIIPLSPAILHCPVAPGQYPSKSPAPPHPGGVLCYLCLLAIAVIRPLG
jgi:hypothetical protein